MSRARQCSASVLPAILLAALLATPLTVAAQAPGVAQAQGASAQASRLYEDALSRYERKDHAGAIVQLKNVLQIDRRNIAAQVLLGRALLATGDIAAAEAALNEALTQGVNRSEVAIPLARALIHQGKQSLVLSDPRLASSGLTLETEVAMLVVHAGAAGDLGDNNRALALTSQARAKDPRTAGPWVAEVPIRIRMRQLQEAREAADKAVQLAPKNAEALYMRGTVWHAQGDVKQAIDWYGRAIAVEPSHIEARVSRAGALLDLKRVDEAERDITALLGTNAKEPRALYLKALVLEEKNDRAGSRAALVEVTNTLDAVPIEYLRFRPQWLMLGGLSHHALGQLEKAKPYLESAQRTQPGSPAAKLLAQIHLADKNVDRAIESLEGYLRAFPNDVQAIQLLASAHLSQGRHLRAQQITGDALKRLDAPQLRTWLGASLVGAGRIGDAASELEATLRRDPNQAAAVAALAAIYIQSGQAARAVKLAEGLAQKRPNDPGVQNLLGTAYAAARNIPGARFAFERAAKLDPRYLTPAVQLANLDASSGSLDTAQARLDDVLKRDPNHIPALALGSRIAEQRGQAAEAQRLLERADDTAGPNNADAAVALVDFHLRRNQVPQAKQALSRATGKTPEALPVLLQAARVALASGELPSARSALTRASGVAVRDANALLQIAQLQARSGDLPGARYSLEKAQAENPSSIAAQALLTEVELLLGETGQAEARARRLIASAPRLGVGHALLGDVVSARGNSSQAIDHYRRAHEFENSAVSLLRLFSAMQPGNPQGAAALGNAWLRTRPNDLTVRRAMATALARSGDMAGARAQFEAIVKADPRDVDALNNLANLVVATDPSAAAALAERALALAPQTPHVIGTAGWAALKSGHTERALTLLRDARLRDPENADTRYFLAAALAQAGRKTEALAEAEAAARSGRAFLHAQANQQLIRTLR